MSQAPPDFDPAVVQVLVQRAKAALRKRARSVRQAMPQKSLADRSLAIVTRLESLEWLKGARSLALFSPIMERGEVDLRSVDTWARGRGIRVFYPLVDQDTRTMSFRDPGGPDKLSERGLGILEPSESDPEAAEIDVIIVPALAADTRGHRLGYGAGYYDATLPRYCPPGRSVGVVFDFQLAAELPIAPHDVALDLVITDRQAITPQVATQITPETPPQGG